VGKEKRRLSEEASPIQVLRSSKGRGLLRKGRMETREDTPILSTTGGEERDGGSSFDTSLFVQKRR